MLDGDVLVSQVVVLLHQKYARPDDGDDEGLGQELRELVVHLVDFAGGSMFVKALTPPAIFLKQLICFCCLFLRNFGCQVPFGLLARPLDLLIGLNAQIDHVGGSKHLHPVLQVIIFIIDPIKDKNSRGTFLDQFAKVIDIFFRGHLLTILRARNFLLCGSALCLVVDVAKPEFIG